MQVVSKLPQLHEILAGWRGAGQTMAFVPTMGNLHAGHLTLVERARALADKNVASIYVNPAQFGPGEDFSAYPRTPEKDLEALAGAGCDLVWMPGDQTMYPSGVDRAVRLTAPPALSGVLCGASRPGHFDGVVTVVARLFNQVGPHIAVFGEKDYQQLLIIAHLVQDLALNIRIEPCPTVRESDGLAMSSRNRYLSEKERAAAPALYRVLREIAAQVGGGEDLCLLQGHGVQALAAAGLDPEYLAIRRAADLGPPAPGQSLRVFAAARLGRARLIDNVPV